jgi:hypothetical protein
MMDETGAGGATAAEPDAAADEYVPARGDIVYATLPKDPKAPKKGRAKVELVVETVDAKNETVTVKDNKTKKVVTDKDGKKLAVPFADLTVE